MSPSHRKGWCPGVLRPMDSGDGLIVRLKITGGVLAPEVAQTLADGAESCGNGLLDLTSRGNLQLRGVTEKALPDLQARLGRLGLVDSDPQAEAIRNILVAPLAGCDPSALIDVSPQARALDALLRSEPLFHRLPGKFLFALDDGGRLALPIDQADIAFTATADADGVRFMVHLGGTPAGACGSDTFARTVTRLCESFLHLRGEMDHRMRDLIGHIGVDVIARQADLDGNRAKTPRGPQAPRILGRHSLGETAAFAAGVPFGRLSAAQLRALAEAAKAADGELRLSPWRAFFLVARAFDPGLAMRLRDAGFLLEDTATVRHVAACPGAPFCRHGATASQEDGQHLAPFMQSFAATGIALHVSACAKGCAHPDAAPVTLIGREDSYDLVLDGRADAVPLLRGLSRADLEKLLPRLGPAADRAALLRGLTCENLS